MSPTIKSSRGGSRGSLLSKFGEEGVDRYKRNFDIIWERCVGFYGAVVCKRNCVAILRRLSTMHECDRQTDDGTVTSIATGVIACW